MTEQRIVANIDTVLLQQLFPSVNRWNRVEGRPRAHDFGRALRAEVRDGLWFLSRQWQLGEFHGDDAGSPVVARACLDRVGIDRFSAGTTSGPLDAGQPLDVRVGRRPLPLQLGEQILGLDIRLLVGRRWLRLLELERQASRLSADYRSAYRGEYGIAARVPGNADDAPVTAHPPAWQAMDAAADRAMDGIRFLQHVRGAGQAFDGVGAAVNDEAPLTALAGRLDAWFEEQFVQPNTGEDAWLPERLEYGFGASATRDAARMSMVADGHGRGVLDWYVLDRAADEALPNGTPAVPAKRLVESFIPAPVVFEGMPDTRWWAFEDRRTNFGGIKPNTTDLGTLLLTEFALLYANDWFLLPYTLDIGTVLDIHGIAVTNVFGERTWVRPAPAAGGAGWDRAPVFRLSPAAAGAPDAHGLVILPTAPNIQRGTNLEEVALVRDEMANMVWGVERRIPLASGESVPGREAGRELRSALERIKGTQSTNASPVAPIRYRVMSTVPEEWIPFIPVHLPGSVRETQLQRAALPRLIEGDPQAPEAVRPRTTLLRQNSPASYFIHEDEVPRAGAVVSLAYRRTRWLGGSVFVWVGADKRVGRGEGSSGLRFDSILATRS